MATLTNIINTAIGKNISVVAKQIESEFNGYAVKFDRNMYRVDGLNDRKINAVNMYAIGGIIQKISVNTND